MERSSPVSIAEVVAVCTKPCLDRCVHIESFTIEELRRRHQRAMPIDADLMRPVQVQTPILKRCTLWLTMYARRVLFLRYSANGRHAHCFACRINNCKHFRHLPHTMAGSEDEDDEKENPDEGGSDDKSRIWADIESHLDADAMLHSRARSKTPFPRYSDAQMLCLADRMEWLRSKLPAGHGTGTLLYY